MLKNNQKPLTEKRRANRKIVSSELRKLRYQAEEELERNTGIKGTYIESLCVALFGSYEHNNRCALSQLERGLKTCDIGMFYAYLRAIGCNKNKIKSEFIRIVSLLV